VPNDALFMHIADRRGAARATLTSVKNRSAMPAGMVVARGVGVPFEGIMFGLDGVNATVTDPSERIVIDHDGVFVDPLL
jgi:hypothetical protein